MPVDVSSHMYAIPTAFVSAMFVVFGLYVLITQGVTRLSVPFVLMCATTFAWQGTWTLLFQTDNQQIAGWLVRLGYLFILFLPTTFYHFVTETARRRARLGANRRRTPAPHGPTKSGTPLRATSARRGLIP